MIVAIILAAGESRRMGVPKPLLAFDGKTFLEHIVSVLETTQVGRIKVVLGHEAERVLRQTHLDRADVVLNDGYQNGQLSSLIEGIRSLGDDLSQVDAILVCLVDHPLISAALVDAMIDHFYRTGKPIVIPKCQGRRGHPVLFAKPLFAELLSAPLNAGAKAVVQNHASDLLELETDDAGILFDVDTPELYEALRKLKADH